MMLNRLKNLIQGQKAEQKFPEREHKVYVAEDGVTIYPPRGPRQFLPWHELERVEIHSKLMSAGSETVYWLLFGTTGGTVLPNGAEGVEDLLVWLQRLPDWDGNAAIAGMSSTVDGEWVCWRRG